MKGSELVLIYWAHPSVLQAGEKMKNLLIPEDGILIQSRVDPQLKVTTKMLRDKKSINPVVDYAVQPGVGALLTQYRKDFFYTPFTL